mmetsp:Transcript_42509/g.110661  ORF Transcript_42509/g.110661 Transcript_42509/m.110661 type:complete len:303 (+) Transcript_42509:566-1474(+)
MGQFVREDGDDLVVGHGLRGGAAPDRLALLLRRVHLLNELVEHQHASAPVAEEGQGRGNSVLRSVVLVLPEEERVVEPDDGAVDTADERVRARVLVATVHHVDLVDADVAFPCKAHYLVAQGPPGPGAHALWGRLPRAPALPPEVAQELLCAGVLRRPRLGPSVHRHRRGQGPCRPSRDDPGAVRVRGEHELPLAQVMRRQDGDRRPGDVEEDTVQRHPRVRFVRRAHERKTSSNNEVVSGERVVHAHNLGNNCREVVVSDDHGRNHAAPHEQPAEAEAQDRQVDDPAGDAPEQQVHELAHQ